MRLNLAMSQLIRIYIFLISVFVIQVQAQDCLLVNDFCANALPLTGEGCNEGATGEPDSWTPDAGIYSEFDCYYFNYQTPCFTPDNYCIAWNTNQNGVWYYFTVDANTVQPFDLEVFDIQCKEGEIVGLEELQLGIWTNNGTCDLGLETLIACASVEGNFAFTELNLPLGDYYLFVDGNGGADCTWRFESEELIPPIDCPNGTVTPPPAICNTETAPVNLDEFIVFDDNSVIGEWTLINTPPNSGASVTSATSNFSILNIVPGIYEFQFDVASPIAGCESADSSRFFMNLEVLESYNEIQEVQICAGETISIGGFTFDDTSTSSETSNETTTAGCDSIITYQPVPVTEKETYIEILACEKQGTPFGNEVYFAGDMDTLNLPSASGICDSVVYIDVLPYPFPDINLPEQFTMTTGSIVLNSGVTDSSSVSIVFWSPTTDLSCSNCFYPTASPDVDTEYTLVISTEDGCSEEYNTEIVIPPIIIPIIPTAFSPNLDGVNDEWRIIYEGAYTSYEAKVFDRWGKEVFSSNSPNEAWSGIESLGKNPPMGIYMYYITIADPVLNETFEYKGTITLIR